MERNPSAKALWGVHMGPRGRAAGLLVVVTVAVPWLSGNAATATVSGTPGRIVTQGWVTQADDVFAMNADGTGVVQLTKNPEYDGDPAWSPDGRTIVFDSEHDKVVHIWTMDATGHHMREVSHGPGDDYFPAWSPDGGWIAYTSDQLGRSALYMVRPDGSQQHRITRLDEDVASPDWSPDGRWIAYASNRSGTWQVYKIHPDGTHRIRLTNGALGAFDVAWSPDGRTIVFDDYGPRKGVPPLACTPVCGVDDNQQVWRVSPDGTGLRQLTALPGYSWTPVWSPDSQQILYSYCAPGSVDCDLHVMNVDGTGDRDISASPTRYEYWPDWQSVRSGS